MEAPRAGARSCQVTLAPGTWGHSARTQELPAAAGSGDALGISCKDVQSCCSSHGAAVPLPIKSLHVRMGGHCGVPHVPSCTPRPHSPKDRFELPWLLAQTQHGGIATCQVLCHSELKQLLSHRKTVVPSKAEMLLSPARPRNDTEPSLVLQPSTWKGPASATLLPLCQPCGCWRAGGGGEGRLQLPWAPMRPCSRSGHWDHETAARPQPSPVLLLQLLCAPRQCCIPHSTAMQTPQPMPLSQRLSPLPPHIPVPLMAVKPLHPPARSGASLLCNVILTAATIYAFPFPQVPLALMALAAHIWKGFSRALKKVLIKNRLAAASAADLALSTSLPCSLFPLHGHNHPTVAT